MYLAYLVTRCVVITRRKQQRPGITMNDKNIGTHKSTRSCGCVVAGSWLSASLRLAACKRLTTVLRAVFAVLLVLTGYCVRSTCTCLSQFVVESSALLCSLQVHSACGAAAGA